MKYSISLNFKYLSMQMNQKERFSYLEKLKFEPIWSEYHKIFGPRKSSDGETISSSKTV